ncbi:hypothetical protein BMW24_004470 [Mycobacterium heckeshornense]|nr:hypothetical protein BMW24_004470 [Mycobacterium heckeshornense]
MAMVEFFACARCAASADPVSDGNSTIAIVRHRPGCSVLAGVIRRRWPLRRDTSLPDTPALQPFAARADWSRWQKVVSAARDRAARAPFAQVGRPPTKTAYPATDDGRVAHARS